MSALDKTSDTLMAPVRLDAVSVSVSVSVRGRHWRCWRRCCARAAIESIGTKLYTESRCPCVADRRVDVGLEVRNRLGLTYFWTVGGPLAWALWGKRCDWLPRALRLADHGAARRFEKGSQKALACTVDAAVDDIATRPSAWGRV
jgi:hypothetical protein